MLLSNGQLLDSLKFNLLLLDASLQHQMRLPLRWLDRTPIVAADDDEITTTFTGKVFAADLIADDQAAAVYEAGQFELVTNTIPNIKIGRRFSQGVISRLNRLSRRAGTLGDYDFWRNWEVMTAALLLRGVHEQMNALIAAMQMNALNYNRMGVQIVNANWGTPSGYLSTPATPWTNTAATPVTDVLTLKKFAANDTGEVYDRITLGTADFINMASTTEFKSLIAGLVTAPILTTGYNPRDPRMTVFASQLLGAEVEIDDKTITTQNGDGTTTTNRVLPAGKVILTSKADDNDMSAMDWANAIVTESQVARLVGDPDNAYSGVDQYGPFGYYTGNPDLNPPAVLAWAVTRGFPRKHRKTATAVLTVA